MAGTAARGVQAPRLRRLAGTAARPALALRVVAFLTLALFAALHWASLIAPAPNGRTVAVCAIAATAGVLIALTGELPRAPAIVARLATVVVCALVTLTVIGIPLELLTPKHWGTFEDRVGGGLSVVGNVAEWPYGGPNVWLRLTTLMAAPLVLTIAAALTFWPRREARGALPFLALVLLVALYGVAVAARPLGHDTLRGLGLLVCLAAWLWMPCLRGRDAVAAAVAVAVAGAAALGLTARVASEEPWVDYRQWSWSLNNDGKLLFDWRHSYGPLNWPRKGTTLLLIKAGDPHYWKAESLDRFDGRVWTTSPPQEAVANLGSVAASSNREWYDEAQVTVRGLRSDQIVAPGTILDISDAPGDSVTMANATYLLDGQLGSGDTYTVRSYTPDPSSRQMRTAPPPDQFFTRYTVIGLPRGDGFEAAPVTMPLRGRPWTAPQSAVDDVLRSRYARVYRLAQRVAAGAATDYEIVRKVGAYLEENYTYSEEPPRRAYPLEAFLFRDRIGYCQQFSGAAALMLRMLGIPTRVASGFAPGTLNRDTREYVVRDLDAHSWIEVWFSNIGWVPFDPTPADAPASSQVTSFALSDLTASAASGNTRDRLSGRQEPAAAVEGAGGGLGVEEDGGTPWGWIVVAGLAGALLLAALVVVLRGRRSGAGLPDPCGDADVDGLVRLLARIGLHVKPGTTLYEIEQRLARVAGPDAAAYAQRLRRRRFAGDQEPCPTRADRRRLRGLLADAVGAGPLTRLKLALLQGPLQRSPALKLRGLQRPR